ncbi:MAG: ATP-binding protein [Mesorhizobium sp.]|nr:MAG: ATP-binding protein [Mesorhizobium sp.]
MKFSPQQADAIDAVSAWHKAKENQVFRVFGYAGTGKTTLARHFAEGLNGRVLYAAYTGKAAMMMRKNGCLNASTIHSTIYAVDVNKTTGAAKFILRPKSEFEGVALLVIDECSMVDQDIGQEILSFGIPVLVLGDPAQLPPVAPGAGFFTECDPDVMLEEIHRQAAESPIIQMATLIREGGELRYGDYGSSRVIPKQEMQQSDAMDVDQVLVGTNRNRSRYNERMREILGRAGTMPERDDRLVCLKNDRTMGLFNGGLWKVLYVAKRRAGHIEDHCVAMDVTSIDFEMTTPVKVRARKECFEGRLNEVNWKELRGTQQFDYGYALTVHKAQGSQWDSVCLLDESRAFADSRARWLYTGLTRAAEKITVVM